jgi:hypothetical protein
MDCNLIKKVGISANTLLLNFSVITSTIISMDGSNYRHDVHWPVTTVTVHIFMGDVPLDNV